MSTTHDTVTLYAGPVGSWYAGLSIGAVAVAFLLTTPLFAGSLALGAVLEAANFRSLRRNCETVFRGVANGSVIATAGFGLRFALLLAAVGGSLYAGAHPVGLVIGLSLIVPSTLIAAWAARPSVDESAAPLDPEDPSWETWNPWFARESAEDEDDA